MNEENQAKLAEYLDALATRMSSAEAFVIEQAPLIVQEYLAYYTISAWAGLILSIAFLALAYPAIKYMMKYISIDNAPEVAVPAMFGTIGAGMGCAVFVINFFVQAHALILVYYAPKLVVIEWLRGIV